MIEDEPYCYLAEYACKISIELGKNVCAATVHYYMKRDLNLTRKKLHRIAAERRKGKRLRFVQGIIDGVLADRALCGAH